MRHEITGLSRQFYTNGSHPLHLGLTWILSVEKDMQMRLLMVAIAVLCAAGQTPIVAQEASLDSARQLKLVEELRSLEHSKTNDTSGAGLSITDDGTKLVLRRWPATDLEECLSIAVRLKDVRSIELDRCQLTCTSFEFLSRISELESLSLHECYGPEDSRYSVSPCFSRLVSLTNLREISLYENSQFISDASFAAVLQALDKLERLKLTHMFKWGRDNGDGSLTLMALAGFGVKERPRFLEIETHLMSKEFDEKLKELSKGARNIWVRQR
jgi:hypothetical protein